MFSFDSSDLDSCLNKVMKFRVVNISLSTAKAEYMATRSGFT